jgi:thioredoxin-like negative regulator of GroEL
MSETQTAAASDDFSQSIDAMDKYLEEQKKKRQDAANQLQNILNKRPLGNLAVNPFSDDFSLAKLDVNLQKQLSAQFGIKVDDQGSVGTKPKPDATNWRLRTRAMRV